MLPSPHTFPANGLLIIGGKKTAAGVETPFTGTMTCLQMWNSGLSSPNIITVFQANRCNTLFEPVLKWYDVKSGTQVGSIKWESPSSITKPNTGEEKNICLSYKSLVIISSYRCAYWALSDGEIWRCLSRWLTTGLQLVEKLNDPARFRTKKSFSHL